jgi:hypothetical protein
MLSAKIGFHRLVVGVMSFSYRLRHRLTLVYHLGVISFHLFEEILYDNQVAPDSGQ